MSNINKVVKLNINGELINAIYKGGVLDNRYDFNDKAREYINDNSKYLESNKAVSNYLIKQYDEELELISYAYKVALRKFKLMKSKPTDKLTTNYDSAMMNIAKDFLEYGLVPYLYNEYSDYYKLLI